MLLAVMSSQAQTWTLNRCLEYAETNNLEILHKKYQYNYQNEVVKEVRQNWIPQVELGAQQTFHFGSTKVMYSYDYDGSVSLTQLVANLQMPIFTGMELTNRHRSETERLHAAEQNIRAEVLNLKINVVAEFLQVLLSKSQVKIADAQVNLSKDILARSRQLVEEGKRPESEIAQAEADLCNSEYLLTNAEGNLIMAKIALANRMNVPYTEEFDIVASEIDSSAYLLPPPSIDEYEINDAFPTIAAAKYLQKSAEYKWKAVRGTMLPKVGLFSTYNNYFFAPMDAGVKAGSGAISEMLRGNGFTQVGLRLSIPIINFSNNRQLARAKLDYRDAQTTLNDMRLSLAKQIRQAYYSTHTSFEKSRSAKEAAHASELAFSYNQELYEVGRTTLYDLTQSRIKWLNAAEEAVIAQYEFITRYKILEYYKEYLNQ